MVACYIITPSVIKVISLLIPLSYVVKGHLQPFQLLCALHTENDCHLHRIFTKQNIMTPFDCESGSCINIYPSRKSTEPVFVLKCSGWLFVHFLKDEVSLRVADKDWIAVAECQVSPSKALQEYWRGKASSPKSAAHCLIVNYCY